MFKTQILLTEPVTHNTKRFILQKPEGLKFVPGQATEIFGHPFTFTSLPTDKVLEFVIKRYPVSEFPTHQGITEKLHTLKAGDTLELSEPFGTIHFQNKGVFLAAGAGITPFISIIKNLFSQNKLTGNRLIFSNKTKKDIIYEQEFLGMFPDGNAVFTLTREKNIGYEYGHVDTNFLKKYITNFSQDFYVCGPPPFVKSLKDVLKSLGANSKSLIFEK